MGIDCKFYIQHPHWPRDWWLCSDGLSLDRDYQLWEALRKLDKHDIPNGMRVTMYHDSGLKEETTDCYGAPLQWVYAGQFSSKLQVPFEELSDYNAAVIQFMRALPPATKVMFYWH